MQSAQHTTGHTGHAVEQSRQLWLQVCRSRGTPAPDQSQVARFLNSLPEEARAELDQALRLCLNGREKGRELASLSWAAACTRLAFIGQVHAHGLACAGNDLFGAGLALMALGWDMSARVAQLAQHPEDIDALRAMLALQAPPDALGGAAQALPTPAEPHPGLAPEPPQADAFATKQSHEKRLPVIAVDGVHTNTFEEEATAFDLQGQAQDRDAASASVPRHLQVRLFGREAAHTLEIGAHRRAGSFMGVQVVTIESARAMGSGGYDWGRKLAVQLTPEEMPEAIAVLMNLSSAARFAQHGAQQDKFVELRRQGGGMVVVTGQASTAYAVPVNASMLYYLLALFARAMASGLPGGSTAEVLALVKATH